MKTSTMFEWDAVAEGEAKTRRNTDEMDEVRACQIIDDMMGRENLEGLIRARDQIDGAIERLKIREMAQRTKRYQTKIAGFVVRTLRVGR